MRVVADMVFTVAMIAVTAGAVAEFQLRIAHVCATADLTSMGVVFCVRTGFRPGKCDGPCLRFSAGTPHSPGNGKNVYKIFSEEEEKVQNSNQREQIVGEKCA